MASVYTFIHGEGLPRLDEEFKTYLQHPSAQVGDWFLYQDYTVIRIYGFEDQPYRLPKFLTRRIFALEFIRQRLQVENELFISHMKASNLKFKYSREPFVINGPDALPKIKDMLSQMNLPKDVVVQYDHLHHISQRRTTNRFPPY